MGIRIYETTPKEVSHYDACDHFVIHSCTPSKLNFLPNIEGHEDMNCKLFPSSIKLLLVDENKNLWLTAVCVKRLPWTLFQLMRATVRIYMASKKCQDFMLSGFTFWYKNKRDKGYMKVIIQKQ
jgi:hypothetical protein